MEHLKNILGQFSPYGSAKTNLLPSPIEGVFTTEQPKSVNCGEGSPKLAQRGNLQKLLRLDSVGEMYCDGEDMGFGSQHWQSIAKSSKMNPNSPAFVPRQRTGSLPCSPVCDLAGIGHEARRVVSLGDSAYMKGSCSLYPQIVAQGSWVESTFVDCTVMHAAIHQGFPVYQFGAAVEQNTEVMEGPSCSNSNRNNKMGHTGNNCSQGPRNSNRGKEPGYFHSKVKCKQSTPEGCSTDPATSIVDEVTSKFCDIRVASDCTCLNVDKQEIGKKPTSGRVEVSVKTGDVTNSTPSCHSCNNNRKESCIVNVSHKSPDSSNVTVFSVSVESDSGSSFTSTESTEFSAAQSNPIKTENQNVLASCSQQGESNKSRRSQGKKRSRKRSQQNKQDKDATVTPNPPTPNKKKNKMSSRKRRKLKNKLQPSMTSNSSQETLKEEECDSDDDDGITFQISFIRQKSCSESSQSSDFIEFCSTSPENLKSVTSEPLSLHGAISGPKINKSFSAMIFNCPSSSEEDDEEFDSKAGPSQVANFIIGSSSSDFSDEEDLSDEVDADFNDELFRSLQQDFSCFTPPTFGRKSEKTLPKSASDPGIVSSKEIRDLNRRWHIGSSSQLEEVDVDMFEEDKKRLNADTKQVSFADAEIMVQVYEVEDWQRRGPWQDFALDRGRFRDRIKNTEEKIGHVFDPDHRDRMYVEIYGEHF